MSDELRLSDAERDAAAADLGEHFAQGRLSVEEHAERLEQIWGARTRGQIPPIFSDLPSPYAATAQGRPTAVRSRPPRGAGLRAARRGIPAPLLVLLAVVGVALVVTHLPLILIGLAVFWCVALKHRGRAGYGPCAGWR